MATNKILQTISELGFLSRPPIVVASIGRSGSSMLFRSILASHPNHRFHPSKRVVRKFTKRKAWELKKTALKNNGVYKTHDLPCRVKHVQPLYIFIFSTPSRAAISVVKRALTDDDPNWLDKHSKHLGKKATIESVIHGDALGFATQIDTWFNFEEAPVLVLKFEKLWENKEILERFLGFKIQLPHQRERTALDSAEYVEKIKENYSFLDAAFKKHPDYFLNNLAKQKLA